MNLDKALRIIIESGMRITESRATQKAQKEEAARRLLAAFPDWTYELSKKPLTRDEKRIAEEAAAPFTVEEIFRLANLRAKDLFEQEELYSLHYLRKSYLEKVRIDELEKERRDRYQKTYNRYKKYLDLWPDFKRRLVDPLVENGYEIVKILHADKCYDFVELMTFLEDKLPGAEPLDGSKIPYEITMRAENSADTFKFNAYINLDKVSLGNIDPLSILATCSDGKAKACIALVKYRKDNGTWDIPMDMFLDAAIEFANADEFLDEEELDCVKKSAESNAAWEKGVRDFYAKNKYTGD